MVTLSMLESVVLGVAARLLEMASAMAGFDKIASAITRMLAARTLSRSSPGATPISGARRRRKSST